MTAVKKGIVTMKKLSSIILTAMLAFNIFAGDVLAAGTPPDQLEKYEHALVLLEKLGLDADADKQTSEAMTRAEFLIWLASIMPADTIGFADTVKAPFKDVLLGHPAAQAINYALAMGVIAKDDYFYPNDIITTAQASKIIVTFLGHHMYAEVNGGYPAGYLTTASRLGIFKGASVSDGTQGVTRYNAVIMLYNMLWAETYDITSVSDNAVRINSSGATFMESRLGTYEKKGIVTADECSGISSPEGRTARGKISIDGERFLYNGSDGYLGHSVTAYYKKDTDKSLQEIIHIEDESQKIEISSNRLVSYKNYEYTYENQKSALVKARVSSGFNMIYNGKAYQEYTDEDFMPDSGKVILIDNDNDGIFDVVNVISYDFMRVSRVSPVFLEVYDANGTDKISANDKGNEFICHVFKYDKGGLTSAQFADITDEDMLAYTKSKDGLYINIYILDGITGLVTAKSGNEIEIDGMFYNTTKYFNNHYFNTAIIGAQSVFYLSPDNKIAGMKEKADSNYLYGCLVAIEEKILNPTRVKVFKQSGSMEIFEFMPYIRINGEQCKSSRTDPRFANAFYEGGEVKPQIIRYKLTPDGSISNVNVAVALDETEREAFFDNVPDDDRLVLYYDESITYTYKSNPKIFYPAFNIAGPAAIFIVPKSRGYINDDDRYFSVSSSYFVNNRTYNLNAYNIDIGGSAEAVVIRTDDAQSILTTESTSGVIEKIVTAVNDEQERCSKITVYNGAFVDIWVPENISLADYAPGDYIRYVADKDNEVLSIALDFDLSRETITYTGTSSSLQYIYGMAYSLRGSYLYISTTKDGNGFSTDWKGLQNYFLPNNFVVFDTKTNALLTGNTEDISTYFDSRENPSRILLRLSSRLTTGFAVIYR